MNYDLSTVRAQLTPSEKLLLYSIVSGGDYCNVGDGRFGGSAIIMALGLKEKNLSGHIWTIDVYKRVPIEKIATYGLLHDVEDYITRLRGMSRLVSNTLLDKVFEFTFIDGAHDYGSVMGDIKAFSRNSKMIGFHDTNMESVDKAIADSGILEWDLVYYVDTIKAFRKP